MPTELSATMMGRLAADSAVESAAAAMRLWHTLFRQFSPLIGPLSAELLFVRSLTTNAAAFPWLPDVGPGETRTAFALDFTESLYRMATVLASKGVTLLMTNDMEDRRIVNFSCPNWNS